MNRLPTRTVRKLAPLPALALLVWTIGCMRTDDLASSYTAPPVIQVATGFAHTCVLFEEETVACMGLTPMIGYGEDASSIGDEEPASNRPGVLSLGGPVKQIDAGDNHTCALTTEGNVICWGLNHKFHLGYPDVEEPVGDNEYPSQVGFVPLPEPGIAQQISMGGLRSCALLENGTVACWRPLPEADTDIPEADTDIREADTDIPEADPAPAKEIFEHPGGQPFVHISTGPAVTGALTADGQRLYYWADGTAVESFALDTDTTNTGVQLAVSGRHSCILFADGRVKCWGSAEEQSDPGWPTNTDFIDLGEGAVAVKVATGDAHSCAVLEDGALHCWGSNASGQLGLPGVVDVGNHEPPASADPVDVGGHVVDVSCGLQHTCAILDTGRIVCWGEAAYGRLGYGNSHDVGITDSPASVGTVPL